MGYELDIFIFDRIKFALAGQGGPMVPSSVVFEW